MSLGGFFPRPARTEEGEKPFWISYADLMTALMLLFLVIMVSALTAISKQTEDLYKKAQSASGQTAENESTRAQEISRICDDISTNAKKVNPSLIVDCRLNRISFGSVGNFRKDQYRLDEQGQKALAALVPVILAAANTAEGKRWLKQVLIEGYTDTDGSYLYNLNLSLKRSEWVMCTLLTQDQSALIQLDSGQRRQIKKLFLAGGVAFNNSRDTKDDSRRVELKLQFYGYQGEEQSDRDDVKFDDNSRERCLI